MRDCINNCETVRKQIEEMQIIEKEKNKKHLRDNITWQIKHNMSKSFRG